MRGVWCVVADGTSLTFRSARCAPYITTHHAALDWGGEVVDSCDNFHNLLTGMLWPLIPS